MKYHHGGRVGDCIFALQTVKMMGGGDVYLSLFHNPGWTANLLSKLVPLVAVQDYVGDCKYLHFDERILNDWRENFNKPSSIKEEYIDLHGAEEVDTMFVDEERKTKRHIGQRYAMHFGYEFDHNEPWIKAREASPFDIILHLPLRRMVRDQAQWVHIISELSRHCNVTLIGDRKDSNDWKLKISGEFLTPYDFLHTASLINSCSLFMGAVSSCNAIAEGLCKRRMVELAPGCDDTYQDGKVGIDITNMDPDQVIKKAFEALDNV